MPIYKKESLELLRGRIDLVDALMPHVALKRTGASYKACCPFHEEKTPSFMVQKGDTHYHCFGCGAHGDAISFLMSYLKMSFVEAVENLAERFQVPLEKAEASSEPAGPSKALLKNALDHACRFYHFALLHLEEGRPALQYLFERGIDLAFIRLFKIGLAPKQSELLRRILYAEGIDDYILEQAGLIAVNSAGRKRDFFSDRITFPICDPMGAVIGFSARKFKEETFGGKYINTSETPLFKKSHVLFGLSYSRSRIAKMRKAIIVEGQIDALRLIYAGFNWTVAGQGTAFGEDHVRELLHLGVNHVFLALDADTAGVEATMKIGHLFQKKGVEVSVASLPEGSDPDALLRMQGPPGFFKVLEKSKDYLSFLVGYHARKLDLNSPSQKNELVTLIAEQIKTWEQPLIVHESLIKLAELTHVPTSIMGIKELKAQEIFVRRNERVPFSKVDPDRILETDLLRWMFLAGKTCPRLIDIVRMNILPEHFRIEGCLRLFLLYLDTYQKEACDLLTLAIHSEHPEDQDFFAEIMQKKINLQKPEAGVEETIEKILQRHWMEQRELIKIKIHSGVSSDEEVLELVKRFDEIRKCPPKVTLA